MSSQRFVMGKDSKMIQSTLKGLIEKTESINELKLDFFDGRF